MACHQNSGCVTGTWCAERIYLENVNSAKTLEIQVVLP